MIEREEQVRGATQHFYRASKRMLFDSDEWATLPSVFRQGVAARALADFLNASREAIEAGTFDARDDSQLNWATIRLDERGWSKAATMVMDALGDLLALEGECKGRIEKGAEAVDATLALVLFEAPRHDA